MQRGVKGTDSPQGREEAEHESKAAVPVCHWKEHNEPKINDVHGARLRTIVKPFEGIACGVLEVFWCNDWQNDNDYNTDAVMEWLAYAHIALSVNLQDVQGNIDSLQPGNQPGRYGRDDAV